MKISPITIQYSTIIPVKYFTTCECNSENVSVYNIVLGDATYLADVFCFWCLRSGVFVTNLAARNQGMKSQALSSLRAVFPKLICIPVPKDVNEVVVGLTGPRHEILDSTFWTESCDHRAVDGGRGYSSEVHEQSASNGGSVEIEQIRVAGEVRDRMTDMARIAGAHSSHDPQVLKNELLELFSSAMVVL